MVDGTMAREPMMKGLMTGHVSQGHPYEPWKSIAASALLQEAVRPNVILGWTASKGTACGSTWVNDGSEVEKKWLHRVVLVLEKGGSLRPWRATLVSSYARALLHSTKYTVQVINQVRQDAQDRVWFTQAKELPFYFSGK